MTGALGCIVRFPPGMQVRASLIDRPIAGFPDHPMVYRGPIRADNLTR
jgi:hypothetical protein